VVSPDPLVAPPDEEVAPPLPNLPPDPVVAPPVWELFAVSPPSVTMVPTLLLFFEQAVRASKLRRVRVWGCRCMVLPPLAECSVRGEGFILSSGLRDVERAVVVGDAPVGAAVGAVLARVAKQLACARPVSTASLIAGQGSVALAS
jgi:hypothetical protein